MPPVTSGTGYVNKVPVVGGVVVNDLFAWVPLQIVCSNPAVKIGVGLTVITTIPASPTQPPNAAIAVGVT